MASKEYHLDYYRRRKAMVIEHHGGQCVQCGSTEDLEMDHIDRSLKTMEFKDCVNANWERADILREVQNMQLLCETCHLAKTCAEKEAWSKHGGMYAWQKKKCECNICLQAKREWYDERNSKRRVSDSPRGPVWSTRRTRNLQEI